MQTLWDFSTFAIGYTPDYFLTYFNKIAKWESLGDLQVCDPTKRSDGGQRDPSDRLREYFSNNVSKAHSNHGYVTKALAEAAGFKLRWSLNPRCLKIEPGQWKESAPLPETNPDDFLFWYCPTVWSGRKNSGGNLLVTPEGEKGQEFKYSAGGRAVLVHNMPHLLLKINKKATAPYYCLYGQLREVK